MKNLMSQLLVSCKSLQDADILQKSLRPLISGVFTLFLLFFFNRV